MAKDAERSKPATERGQSAAVSDGAGAALIAVYAKPRASRSKVLGVNNGVLEVALAAPPVDGEANDELIRVLAAALGVPRRSVRLLQGQSGRNKRVEIQGVSAADVMQALEAVAKASEAS